MFTKSKLALPLPILACSIVESENKGCTINDSSPIGHPKNDRKVQIDVYITGIQYPETNAGLAGNHQNLRKRFHGLFNEFLGGSRPILTIHSPDYTVHSIYPRIPKGSEIALWYQIVNSK